MTIFGECIPANFEVYGMSDMNQSYLRVGSTGSLSQSALQQRSNFVYWTPVSGHFHIVLCPVTVAVYIHCLRALQMSDQMVNCVVKCLESQHLTINH